MDFASVMMGFKDLIVLVTSSAITEEFVKQGSANVPMNSSDQDVSRKNVKIIVRIMVNVLMEHASARLVSLEKIVNNLYVLIIAVTMEHV